MEIGLLYQVFGTDIRTTREIRDRVKLVVLTDADVAEGVDLAAVLKRKLGDDDDTRKEAKELFKQAYERCEPALQAAKAELEGGQLVGIESLLGRWIEDFTSVAPTKIDVNLEEVSTVAYLKEAFFRLLSDEQLKGWVEQNKDITELSLEWNQKITSLPESLGECKALTSLNLPSCKKVISLPDSIGKLEHLKALLLGGCVKLTVDRDQLKAQLPNCKINF